MAESTSTSRLASESVEPMSVFSTGAATAVGQTLFWLLVVIGLMGTAPLPIQFDGFL